MKNVALITGASSGIGFDVALRLLEKGYTVYAAARRTELMEEIVQKGGYSIYLDLNDDNSIKSCVNEVLQKEGKIDLLINNAGYGLGGSLEDIPLEKAKQQFEVNVFGMFRIIQLVLPSMRNQKSGKIINVSSMAARFSTPFTGWYHASKYSVEALSDALRMEVKKFGIKVVIVEPGLIKTNWGVIHSDNIQKYSGSTAYAEYAKDVSDYFRNSYTKSKFITKPETISKLIAKIAFKKNPRPRYIKGKNAHTYIFAKSVLPTVIYDKFLTLRFLLERCHSKKVKKN